MIIIIDLQKKKSINMKVGFMRSARKFFLFFRSRTPECDACALASISSLQTYNEGPFGLLLLETEIRTA
jgi:hypothetical protein